MGLSGVIFDMGGTLLYYHAPGESWVEAEQIGAAAAYRVLEQQGATLMPLEEALALHLQRASDLWADLSLVPVDDLKLDVQIGQVAREWGAKVISSALADDLALAYMRAVQVHVHPLEGALDTLSTLHEMGLRIGLISNTVWPGVVHRQDLDRWHVSPWIEHMIFSADVEVWKPDPAIFQLGLDALDLAADETIYVGDSLYFDVWGASQAGLRSVWIEQDAPWLPGGISATPDATVHRLPDLISVIEHWR